MKKLVELLKHFLSAFFPFRCHACQTLCNFGEVLCPNCKEKIATCISYPEKVNDTICDFPLYSMSSYDSFAASCIKIIKYRPSRKLAVVLANSCVKSANLQKFLNKNDVLIPVPMHKKRLKERGFNQASVIAETYAEKVGCHFCPAVVRNRFTRPQADCTEKERKSNLENTFVLDPDLIKESLTGKRLIIIDDVATTGTTLKKSIEPLLELKAKEIIALVISHPHKKTS